MGASEEECTALGAFLIPFHVKHAFLPLDPEKAMENIWATANDSIVYNAYYDDELVGSISLFVHEVWYSKVEVMWNRWLCVAENAPPSVIIGLLGRAKWEASAAGTMLIIERSNHKQVDLRGNFNRLAELVGFSPFGHVQRMAGGKEWPRTQADSSAPPQTG